jgi:hypothetical protein
MRAMTQSALKRATRYQIPTTKAAMAQMPPRMIAMMPTSPSMVRGVYRVGIVCKSGSSAEFVGEFRLWQVPELMKQGGFEQF